MYDYPTNNPVRVFGPEPGVFVVLIDGRDGSTKVADRFTFDADDWDARTAALDAARKRAKWWRRQHG